MKNIFSLLLCLLTVFSLSGQEKKVKTGWKFGGALPAVTFDSNLGFQYGALFEFFNYGDPSVYPKYYDHTYTEVSRFTKGSGIYRFMFETNHLIPGVEWMSDLSYLTDQANHFYGFNGYVSVFNKDWMDTESSAYRSAMFYRFSRNQFRFKNDFVGKLSGDHLKWSAGFALNNFRVGSVDIDKLNKGKKEDKKLPPLSEEPGLFELYRDSLGIINANEADGGWVNTIKAGLVWDSRDNRPNPMRGIWTEMGIEISPGFLGNDWGFSKFYITHRQYFTLVENDLALALRLGYQTTLSGKVPFFYQSQVITYRLTGYSSEGLGGTSTMRGILNNRIVGDAFVLGNVELRWKPVYFKFLKQDWYLGVNLFYDLGMITKEISLPDDLQSTFSTKMTDYTFSDFFRPGQEKIHQCAGISIMPVMNQNFVIAVDIGKAFNSQDGNIGFAIGLNYLF
ncbi:MAG TPA: BamA/TamA family outer membrane protein [Bacteroidales bacterium]|nr:BamA/TamA family outer membrane protein [Bacteroidales bacterium]HNR42056.1 BamA/TamA family outer membrane protein [Bacteroidales bacterium]HPM18464.1 BamA/TamA family outer membrane protein [Bacteroidales bacterium]